MTVAGQKQLTDLLREKDALMETLKQGAAEARSEAEGRLLAASKDVEALRQAA